MRIPHFHSSCGRLQCPSGPGASWLHAKAGTTSGESPIRRVCPGNCAKRTPMHSAMRPGVCGLRCPVGAHSANGGLRRRKRRQRNASHLASTRSRATTVGHLFISAMLESRLSLCILPIPSGLCKHVQNGHIHASNVLANVGFVFGASLAARCCMLQTCCNLFLATHDTWAVFQRNGRVSNWAL